MPKYWLEENPCIARSNRNVVRLYKDAGILHVSKPDWTDKQSKEVPGKTIALNITAFMENDTKELIEILNYLINKLEGGRRNDD